MLYYNGLTTENGYTFKQYSFDHFTGRTYGACDTVSIGLLQTV